MKTFAPRTKRLSSPVSFSRLNESEGKGGTALAPPPLQFRPTTIQEEDGKPEAPPQEKEDQSKEAYRQILKWDKFLYGEERSKWPLRTKIAYELLDFPDSGGKAALPKIIADHGPIDQDWDAKNSLSIIEAEFKDAEDKPEVLGILLKKFIEGGQKAIADNVLRTDTDVLYREGGYDAMAAYISSETEATRTPTSSYKFKEDSLRLSQDEGAMKGLHEMGYWEDLGRRAGAIALQEHEAWTKEDGTMYEEDDPEMLSRLEKYWETTHDSKDDPNKTAGVSSTEGMAKGAAADKYAWSAAFISYVMHAAGAGDTFQYGDGHTVYAKEAKRNNAKSDTTHPFKLHSAKKIKKGEKVVETATPVQVGDLVHKEREDSGASWSKISGDTHSDIVTAIKVYDAAGAVVYESYDALVQAHAAYEAPEGKDKPSLKDFLYKTKKCKIYATAIGGNTSNRADNPTGTKTKNTAGLHYVELNYDLTLRSSSYYGVQRMGGP